jgi:hypothetical protein
MQQSGGHAWPAASQACGCWPAFLLVLLQQGWGGWAPPPKVRETLTGNIQWSRISLGGGMDAVQFLEGSNE